MNILADHQILLIDELFSSLGNITRYDARELTPDHLKNIDILLTRSTVQVNQALLHRSSVKFVGTCTIGKDHLDTEYLDQQNIVWCNAPGCNANAVVQYDLSVMAQLKPDWMQLRIGIIAAGNIGGRVYRRLKAMGVNCCCYDPFLDKTQVADLVSLDEVLSCDIILSHAPLTETGEYPTKHMLGKRELDVIHPESLLLSAGRGAVIDNQALLDALKENKTFLVALDVWENEPDISEELLHTVDMATPHIAGYSLQGKENGSVMVYQRLCEFLAVDSQYNIQEYLHHEKSFIDLSEISLNDSSQQDIFNHILLQTYPVINDDSQLRHWDASLGSLGQHFHELRKHYPMRQELSHFTFPEKFQETQVHTWVNALLKQD